MADEHDDLLNFENDDDFGDGTLNEDELLLSDEENFETQKDEIIKKQPSPQPEPRKLEASIEESAPPEESVKNHQDEDQVKNESPDQHEAHVESEDSKCADGPVDQKHSELLPEQSTVLAGQSQAHVDPQIPDDSQYPAPPKLVQQQHSFPIGMPRGQFRPRGPRGMLRWMPPGSVPFPTQRPLRTPLQPAGRMPLSQRPFPPHRNPFFMQQRPGQPGQPIPPPGQRFFFQNSAPRPSPVPPPVQQPAAYIPSPIGAVNPIMPRKVLINPNFKGGIEAVKTQLLKDHFSTASGSLSEDELLRRQQEFINSNIRSIEKRRYERSPSPDYRRSYSHSPSPPRNHHHHYHRRRGGPFRAGPYERRRSMGDRDKNQKEKDENLPEEDEETRAYRLKIESQRKQREELLKQKEMRRKQQMEAKAKETEPLKPIVVTEKKIILTKKPRLEERSTTPPIDEAPIPPTLISQRRILLKTGNKSSGAVEQKVGIDASEKRKSQKIIKAEN